MQGYGQYDICPEQYAPPPLQPDNQLGHRLSKQQTSATRMRLDNDLFPALLSPFPNAAPPSPSATVDAADSVAAIDQQPVSHRPESSQTIDIPSEAGKSVPEASTAVNLAPSKAKKPRPASAATSSKQLTLQRRRVRDGRRDAQLVSLREENERLSADIRSLQAQAVTEPCKLAQHEQTQRLPVRVDISDFIIALRPDASAPETNVLRRAADGILHPGNLWLFARSDATQACVRRSYETLQTPIDHPTDHAARRLFVDTFQHQPYILLILLNAWRELMVRRSPESGVEITRAIDWHQDFLVQQAHVHGWRAALAYHWHVQCERSKGSEEFKAEVWMEADAAAMAIRLPASEIPHDTTYPSTQSLIQCTTWQMGERCPEGCGKLHGTCWACSGAHMWAECDWWSSEG